MRLYSKSYGTSGDSLRFQLKNKGFSGNSLRFWQFWWNLYCSNLTVLVLYILSTEVSTGDLVVS